MSRSALLKQQGRVQEREERADELFRQALEEGRLNQRSSLPLWGPDDGSFHWNPLLLHNTIHSQYFQKCCCTLKDWSAVIDEIYFEVKHLTPFQDGHSKAPSTAFCLLLRLLTLRMTPHQMDLTLKHADSPYIRGIGFLYLRYAGPPEQAWQWIEPYVQDFEELVVETGRQAKSITMGEYVRKLFSNEREYYGTPLPRFPIQVEREIMVKLLQAETTAERAAQHFKIQQRMKYFQTLGSRVMALYGDDESPVEWYEAVIDRVITRDEQGNALVHPKFIVTFPEYGNTETVTLGEVDVLDGKWKSEKRAEHQPRGYDHPWQGRDLYEEVRRREREGVTADKGWARRPPTTKANLSSVAKSGHVVLDDYRPPPARPQHRQPRGSASDVSPAPSAVTKSDVPPARKRTAEELAAIEEKKRRLMAKYG
jgi:pre-mRNA-splicing factor 38B